MLAVQAIVHFIERQRRRWRQRQTKDLLDALPPEVRKDIGWPTSLPVARSASRVKDGQAD